MKSNRPLITPPALQPGQTVRVIAPSRSLSIVSENVRSLACQRLAEVGLKVEFGKHAEETGPQGVATVEHRLQDLHDAFADPDVHGILTVIGGYHANQILGGVDFELIRNNPKMFCGFSDITVLSNAITHRSGLATYYGPHFSSFGMLQGLDYTLNAFQEMVMGSSSLTMKPSPQWSDDEWYLDQNQRTFVDNTGWIVVSDGVAERTASKTVMGRIVGGNLSTFGLLRGTEYMPDLSGSILFLEDTDLTGTATLDEFGRQLEGITQVPGFDGVKGLVIGRFQKGSQVTEPALRDMLDGCRALNGVPVLANVDLGHTTPIITFPIGGQATLTADSVNPELIISLY